ncbi:hypothetical protein [Mycolicibacterium palauense]|uniref:hypothetical protein n=1 Tax=Mycolicibacterium palauense TaxID=2034511 RepID=UPI001FEAEF1E|nr:hypothetical protein [Mycolicibacterium palauense]
MGRPSPQTVALRERIVAALRGEGSTPASTRRVCELLGARRYDETGYRIYPQLCALDRLGVVERIRPGGDCQDVFWRLLGDPTDVEMAAAVDLDAAQTGDVDEEYPSFPMVMARLDALGAALAATRSIRDVEIAGRALDANLVELRAIRRLLDHAVRAEAACARPVSSRSARSAARQ